MGTHSSIAIEHPDGSVTAVYCHWDGYLSFNGKILYENYGQEKLIQLLSLGFLSSLGPEIGEKHDFDSPDRTVCSFYGRDRNETDVDAVTYDSRKAWLNAESQEYNYLLDVDGVWLVEQDNKFVPLEAVLKRERLV